MRHICECARIIRKYIFSDRTVRWTFDGSLNSDGRDYNIPVSLKVLLRRILEAPIYVIVDRRAW